MTTSQLSGPRHLSVPTLSPVIKQEEGAVSIEVYTQQLMAAVEGAIAREAALVVTVDTVVSANALVTDLAKAEKAIEHRADVLTAPLKQTVKAVNGMRDELVALLNGGRKSLQSKLMAFKAEQDAAAAKAKREAAEAARIAREAAEVERKRMQAIADAEHAAKVAEAKAKAERDAKDLEELLGSPVEVAPVAVAPAPVVVVPVATPVVVPVAAPVAVAVTTRVDKRVEVTDLKALCKYIAEGGATDLINVNTTALKNALVCGAVIPGARLIEVETLVNKGVRG